MIKIEIYKDKAGEYRSRIKARNGRIRFDSGEGYKRKSAAFKSVHNLIKDMAEYDFVVVEI